MRKRGKTVKLLLAAMTAFLAVTAAKPAVVMAQPVQTGHTLNGQAWTETALYGADRYKTAAEVANAYTTASGAAPREAVLVYGQNFPDALSAGSLAGVRKCPIILSQRNALSADTKTLLTTTWNRSVKTVIMVGGGFSSTVVSDLKACGVENVDTQAYAGSDRYKTAEMVARAVKASGATMCAVATGWKAADALSISSWSYALKIPILLANKNGELSADTLAVAKSFQHVFILGETSVVSANAELQIGDIAERLGGADRYETSRNIAIHFLKHYAGKTDVNYENAVIAKGTNANYPDALVGGPLAGLFKAPVILVSDNGFYDSGIKSVKTAMRTGISNGIIKNLYLLGAAGYGAPRDVVIAQLS